VEGYGTKFQYIELLCDVDWG